MTIVLRRFQACDGDTVFRWRNDPYIVERSSSRRTVERHEHDAWFARILHDPDTLAFIVEHQGLPIGQVRIDHHASEAIISAYLMPGFTGQGLGLAAIRRASAQARRQWPDSPVVAHVRDDNAAGQAAFEKAGFVRQRSQALAGHVGYILPPLAEEQRTARRYGDRARQFGVSVEALNWGSQAGQQRRFQALADVASLHGQRVLDVGCGFGDFLGWLRAQGIDADYVGLDITPEFVEAARSRYPGQVFRLGSVLDEDALAGEQFDYVISSGIFATYSEGAAAWMKAAVSSMWRAASKGVAFNSLSGWATEHEPGEFHADPLDTVAFCRQLTPWVTLRHDYHPRDFSVYMRRAPTA